MKSNRELNAHILEVTGKIEFLHEQKEKIQKFEHVSASTEAEFLDNNYAELLTICKNASTEVWLNAIEEQLKKEEALLVTLTYGLLGKSEEVV